MDIDETDKAVRWFITEDPTDQKWWIPCKDEHTALTIALRRKWFVVKASYKYEKHTVMDYTPVAVEEVR